MRHIPLYILIGLIFVQCSENQGKKGQRMFAEDMVEIMQNMKVYTLNTCDLVPDSLLDFRPTPEVMSFEEQTAHIITNMYVQLHCFIKQGDRITTDQAVAEAGKLIAGKSGDELHQVLADQFDAIIVELKKMHENGGFNSLQKMVQFDGEPEKDMMTILMMMRDHITHHRAQMIVYLRLMGQTPPDYVPY